MSSLLVATLAQFRRPWRWWCALAAEERVLYRAAVLLATGSGLIWAPLALLMPGLLFAAVFFEFSLRRPG